MKRIYSYAVAAALSVAGIAASESNAFAACSANDAAELTRLRGEMGTRLKKNAHSGVVATFQEMLKLGKKGCEIKPDDYKGGGYSAQNSGDIATALEWYKAASASNDVANIQTRYGQVNIKEKKGELTKEGGLPFAPDERAALEKGAEAVKANGKFEGYLPIGKYTLGGKTFEVTAGAVTKV